MSYETLLYKSTQNVHSSYHFFPILSKCHFQAGVASARDKSTQFSRTLLGLCHVCAFPIYPISQEDDFVGAHPVQKKKKQEKRNATERKETK